MALWKIFQRLRNQIKFSFMFRLPGFSKLRAGFGFRVFGGSGGGRLLASASPVGIEKSAGLKLGWARPGDGWAE